jgi:hypothetical protein
LEERDGIEVRFGVGRGDENSVSFKCPVALAYVRMIRKGMRLSLKGGIRVEVLFVGSGTSKAFGTFIYHNHEPQGGFAR